MVKVAGKFNVLTQAQFIHEAMETRLVFTLAEQGAADHQRLVLFDARQS